MNQSYDKVVNSHLALLALSESVEMAVVRSVRKTVLVGRSWLGPGGKYLAQESLHGSHLKLKVRQIILISQSTPV